MKPITVHLARQEPDSRIGAWCGKAAELQSLIARAPWGNGMTEIAAHSWYSADWLLVRACVHEAGHAVVAENLGFRAQIYIDRARLGTGHCSLHGQAGLLTSRSKVLIGLAGAVAAQIAEYGRAADASWIARYAAWPGTLSLSDAELSGSYQQADIATCRSHVLQHWPAIVRTARRELASELAAHGRRGLD